MDRTKFVLLQEPIAATEATNLLCHVVASKAAPQLLQAPVNANNALRHSTTPFATPKCHTSIRLGNFMSIATDQGVGDRVSQLLNIAGLYGDGLQILQDCRAVKRYVLESPRPAFQQLMASDMYSQQVRNLLERSIQKQGYLITGFLTYTDDSWLMGAPPQEMDQSGNIPLRYAEDIAVPVPFLYDDLIGSELAGVAHPCPEPVQFASEQIFAISYKAVKLSQEQSAFGRHISPTPAVARPRRSNAYHLTSSRADHTWVQQQATLALRAGQETITMEDDEALTEYVPNEDLFIFV